MTDLRYTLLSEGPSDASLLPILTWLLLQNGVQCAIQPQWADLRRLPRPPKTLHERMVQAVDLYPCDLIFVHRDSDRSPREMRLAEIRAGEARARELALGPPAICVIPVRMFEAWLLFDKQALRFAADNPNGRERLTLPLLRDLESEPNPKILLNQLLQQASGLTGRRKKKLITSSRATRVASYIDDFSPLRNLPAFAALEADIQQFIAEEGWDRVV